ncbi:MAG: hypothetical protein KER_00126 [Kerstersia gyiorum]|uniref:glycosyltransferase family 4 protein n=1 Tax=Kerstersia gyiorum TaxID=206506 RepID=UPI0030D252F3
MWRGLSINPDVVFATSTPLTIGIPAVCVSKAKRKPLVFEVRDLWPEVPIALGIVKGRLFINMARWLEKWIYKSSSRIIALSPGMKDGVLAVVKDVSVDVIPNAADIDLFNTTGSGLDFWKDYPDLLSGKVLLYTGTIGVVNNISYLVDLAVLLLELNPEIKIAVFGTGAEEGLVWNYAEEKGVLGINFFIYAPIPKKNLPELLRRAEFSISTVLPVPELWKNSANKFFDAMAAGVPVLINYGGWQSDVIVKHQVGLVLHSQARLEDAKKIVEALRDEEFMLEARRAIYQLACGEYNREILFEKFENSLKSTLA